VNFEVICHEAFSWLHIFTLAAFLENASSCN